MLKRIHIRTPFYAVLIFCFLSCNKSVHSIASEQPLKTSFEEIYRKYDYSQKGFDSMVSLFRYATDKDPASVLYYYNYAALYYQYRQEYQIASRYADSMLCIVNLPAYKNSMLKERVLANIDKADALYRMNRYKDCYYYYSSVIADVNKAQDSSLTNNLFSHLAMFLYEEGDYEKAIFYYKQLLVDASGSNHTYEHLIYNQGVMDNMGISFLKAKKEDSAIACFTKAISDIREASRLRPQQQNFCRLALGVVYGNLGQAYVLAHRYEEAESLYKISIAINSQPGYASENALITEVQLAELYYEEKNTPALHETLESIKTGLDSISNSYVAVHWNYLMSRYNATVNQPAKALAYLDKYIQLNDVYVKNTINSAGSNLFDQMKLMQSKYNMTLLEKDNQRKKAFLWIASILFTLSITIALLLLIYAKKSKKSVNELTLLNNEIQDKQTLLEATLAELEKQNIEKQHILYVVAHDLRNPLSAIYTLAGVVQNEYENEDENREYLEIIRSACMESNQLINSILEIAENTDVKYDYEAADVNVILSDNMHLLRMKAKEKNQRIGLMTAQEKGTMYIDIEKINRVIANLVTNAIKFSPSGSYIEIEAVVSEQYITIQVKDNGIGIPEKYHDSIFNAFTDAKRTGTNGEKTFGLGLSISKQIIERHHGRIWFESVVNKGTTFFIQLSRLEDSVTPADNISSRHIANVR